MAELLLSIVYFLLAYVGGKAHNLQRRVQKTFTAYVFLSGLWMVGQFVVWQRLLPAGNDLLALWIPSYGVLALTVGFLALGMAFFPLAENERPWFWLGLIWIVGVLGLVFLRPLNPDGRDPLAFSLLIVGWLLVLMRSIILAAQAFKVARQPMHRNRIFFWALALTIMTLGDVAIFAGGNLVGVCLRLAGTLACAYVLIFHRLLDFIQAGARVVSFLAASLSGVVLYAILYAWLSTQVSPLPGDTPLIFGLVLGAMLIFLANPAIEIFHRWLNRLMLGVGYRTGQIVREYSLAISNLVDLSSLAMTVLALIRKTFGSHTAYMFLVSEEYHDGQPYACLKLLQADGGSLDETRHQGLLNNAGPVAVYLQKAHQPLTQYDLDLLPEFRGIFPEERAWLNGLDVELYMPIHDRTGWIGLLALGAKSSGTPYSDEDMSLLATLADQTAVALANTRHFSELARLNDDLTLTSRALQQANQQLQEMDQLKSGFIGVITHELRTPFANMGFSLQLLQMYSRERLTPEQQDQLDQLDRSIQAGRTMIDNLVMYASFLNRQVQVAREALDVNDLFKAELPPLKEQASEKGVNFHVNILGELLPVRADRKLLSNAIHQLTLNAIKFTPPKGDVWISCWTTSSELMLDVKDSGIGISAEQMAVLWNGFSQAADQLRRGQEGLGLGLALVKFIVEAHGGDVWAESQPKMGSTFGFRIPLQEPAGQPASQKPNHKN